MRLLVSSLCKFHCDCEIEVPDCSDVSGTDLMLSCLTAVMRVALLDSNARLCFGLVVCCQLEMVERIVDFLERPDASLSKKPPTAKVNQSSLLWCMPSNECRYPLCLRRGEAVAKHMLAMDAQGRCESLLDGTIADIEVGDCLLKAAFDLMLT